MTIRQLETFIAIVETNSFTAAAERCGYAQSTVTTQIKQLEDELGCLLFERLGKSVSLTLHGERMVDYARKMISLEQDILLNVPDHTEPFGTLRLGISESFCHSDFPMFLAKYKKLYPKVELQLKFIDHTTFPVLLTNGKLDMVYTLNPHIDLYGFTTLFEMHESIGFFASPEFGLAKMETIKEDDLNHVPLLLTSEQCNFRIMLHKAFQKKNIDINIALDTSNKTILKEFAQNALGVAFLPELVVKNELEEGTLVKLNWIGTEFVISRQIIVHKDKKLFHTLKHTI